MKTSIEMGTPILRVRASAGGSLDATNAACLKDAVLGGLHPGTVVIVSLRSVHTIDSAGAGALVATLKAARAQGGSLALVEVSPEVQRVLELTRLSSVFEIHPDEKSALAALLAVRPGD